MAHKLTEEQKEELVSLARRYGSVRRAAKEQGLVSYTTAAEVCKEHGVFFPSPREIAMQKNDSITYNGMKFFYNEKCGYRASVNGKRILLSNILYKERFGCDKPRDTVMAFRDGDRHNISADNVYFMTKSEYVAKYNHEHKEVYAQAIKKAAETWRTIATQKPWLMDRARKRAWVTRRERDPDNLAGRKIAATKAEKKRLTGSVFNDPAEARRRNSEAHKGLTKEKRAYNKAMRERQTLAQKLGMKL